MKGSFVKHLPNMLTFGNMAIGILIVCSMIHERSPLGVQWACYFIFLAAAMDGLDGFLARRFRSESEMGRQLDSFADFISFGVAPITIFLTNLPGVSLGAMFILLLYPLAGGYRLVRHNLQRQGEYFMGLPITAAGIILSAVLLLNSLFHDGLGRGFAVFFLLLTTALSFLMVSRFRISRIACSRLCPQGVWEDLGDANHELSR